MHLITRNIYNTKTYHTLKTKIPKDLSPSPSHQPFFVFEFNFQMLNICFKDKGYKFSLRLCFKKNEYF